MSHVNVTINGRQYRTACEEGQESRLLRLAEPPDPRWVVRVGDSVLERADGGAPGTQFTLSARSGTPRLLSGDRLFGAMPVLDMAQRMRVEAYNPALPTERMAVRMTKFIKSAA